MSYLLAAMIRFFGVSDVLIRLIVAVGVLETIGVDVVVVGTGFEPRVLQSLKTFGSPQTLAGQADQCHQADEDCRPHQAKYLTLE